MLIYSSCLSAHYYCLADGCATLDEACPHRVDFICYEICHGLNAPESANGFVVDQPVGTADWWCGGNRHEFRVHPRDEGVQDRNSCARTCCFNLTESRRD